MNKTELLLWIYLYEKGNLSQEGIVDLMQSLNDNGLLYKVKDILEKGE